MKRLFILLALALGLYTTAQAQCSSTNHAFQSGETLSYDLYFNWKFVWVKVGSASMNVTRTSYASKPAYRAHLITRSSQQADKFFRMRDTLLAYTTLDLVPLYYRKGADEKDTYRRSEVWYSYPSGKSQVKMRYQKEGSAPVFKTEASQYCAFDMISMLLRARSFDASHYKTGQKISFIMADGKRCEWQSLVFRGKDKFKIEGTNTTYRCLVFSFMEKEDGKESEVAKFYVTDDLNHVPVRIDMNLRFGSAKAYLRGAKGLRNPQTSKQ